MAAQFSAPLPHLACLFLTLSFLNFPSPCLCDPAPIQDICVADMQAGQVFGFGYPCKPAANTTDDDFFTAMLATEADTNNPFGLGLTRADINSFPGINTIGMSVLRADLAPGGIIPAHVHPRSSEVVLVLKGRVLVGFVTAVGRMFSKVLKKGEMYVVPRGLVHFQQNVGPNKALLYAVFQSQNAGLVIAGNILFGSKPEIPSSILAKGFLTDEAAIEAMKLKFGN